jgi:hypothetical protein
MATTTFNDLITFSRGSNATVTGPNGLIQWAPSNLLTNSQDFEAAAWVKAQTTVTANATTAPDGTLTADKILETAVTNAHAVYANFTYVAGTIYAASVYAKAAERSWIYLGADTSAAEAVFFDLSTGTVGNQGTGYVGSIQSVGDGWYRCTVIITQSTALPPNYFVVGVASADNTASYAGVATSGVFIWGAQLELGSTATTYNNTSVRNLLGFSEAFDNAAWTKGNSSIVTGAQANPVNGLFNAQKLMENTANAEHSCRQSASGLIASTPITVSVYLKAAERTIARVLNLDGANFYGIFVDLATGSFISTSTSGTFSNGSYSIASVGSGWFRVSVTATIAGTARSLYINTGVSGPSASYTGDGNSGVYIYGAMLSNSASLDPYVPTPGAAPSSTAYYGPRFDYDPVTLAARGLLVEEARTNLLLRSQEFDNAAYTNSNVTVTANAIAAPDGTTTADLLAAASTASVNLQQSSAVAATSATYSIFVKKGSGATQANAFRLRNTTTATTLVEVTINYDTGVLTYVTGSTGATSVNFGNGWWRVVLTATTGITSGDTIRCDQCFVGASTIGHSAYVWGAQLEAGAFATSYIPTIASTVTRSADVATITGSLFSQWYRQDEGSFIADAVYAVAVNLGDRFTTQTDDGTANNRLLTTVDVAAVDVGGVRQATLDGGTPLDGASNKLAFAYKANDFAVSLNSAAVVTDTSGTLPTVNRLTIGSRTGGASYFNGWLRSIRYVPVRAADFQLQQVTT